MYCEAERETQTGAYDIEWTPQSTIDGTVCNNLTVTLNQTLPYYEYTRTTSTDEPLYPNAASTV